MRLRYIELFHAVLTTGSITGAAKLLNISQPAASKALQHAEDRLGFALFSRVRGRLQPTPQALLMRDRIEKIIQEVHDLDRLTKNMGQPGNDPLRVTSTPTLALTLLAGATALLRKAVPDVVAELSTQHSAMMCESLTLRETDIGLTLQDTGHQNLRQRVLCRGQVMVIAPPGWWPETELAQPLPIEALANQPMIGITVRDVLGSMLQSHLAKVDPAPRTAVSVQTYQLAHSLVTKGEGLALVDPFTARCGGANSVQIRTLKPHL
ncbi:MAG: LysR family transcriptional regulator, partial [Gammaproteobacteria bacterium]